MRVKTSSGEVLFVDDALSRRLELAEADAGAECAATMMRLHPEFGAAVETIAGGRAAYLGPGSPLTQATGVGMDGEVTAEEFAKLENFFFSRGAAVNVETSPFAHASLFELYGKRGFCATEHSSVLVSDLAMDALQPSNSGVRVALVEPEQDDLWVRTVSAGFAEHFPVTDELLAVMELFAAGPNATKYLAFVDDKVAGGGALSMRLGVAGIFGASTLPEFRRRGVQRELIRVRLDAARAAGCDFALTFTQVGSGSQRNLMRNGFRVAYTRTKYTKEFRAR
ncbi:MAG TPA: GNAT family N-acetyltransferase [Candidatus Acidoferrales bacterium]|nr:GNAT family N-acetyltransferase [Candidatus Acidoferrales bacterium]